MDALRPGHAHRSSSDRLLSNYLDAQKSLSTSLLTLLSHSHSSTSSLLAYTTSSPGVQVPVRRAVRHAAFEGPLSAHLVENPEAHLDDENPESPGWAAYVSSLDRFRKDLKQIHMLEEEMSRVRRDREILVTRLIKSTKSRPKKADLTAMSQEYGQHRSPSSMSSRASTISLSSVGSFGTKESKRANKLAEAQAELLGCEEHLRGLEVRIESERNQVMSRGLEERFRAMEAVGRMWVRQSRRGLDDLEKIHELPRDAFELDSNGSIAPSQSASQIGNDDASIHRRGGVPFPRGGPQGSIAGSIIEEDENSSDDGNGNGRNLTVHENRPQSQAGARGPGGPPRPAPIGVPSVTAPRTAGRRAASDVGYHPPASRIQSLRRTNSTQNANNNVVTERADSDASSVRDVGGKKKKGFFSSIAKMFKGNGNKRDQRQRSGRDSPGPVYQSGGWSTRTDQNIKRSGSAYGRRGNDDSSDDEDQGNFVSVSNNRNSNTFSVDNIGRVPAGKGGSVKRNSSMPIASGLIPAKPASRSAMGAGQRSDSQSTVTAKQSTGTKTPTQRPSSRASTVKSGSSPALAPPIGGITRNNTAKSASTTNITRSNTMKSTASASTAKSGSPAKSTRIRPNGSISRAVQDNKQAAEGRTIMSIVDMDPPPMPEVPKAPRSHVDPKMELARAPGSSLVPASLKPPAQTNGSAGPKPIGRSNSNATSLARSNSSKRVSQAPPSPQRSTTPLPPSRMLSPPLKSALRPTSPAPNHPETKSTPIDLGPPPQMFSISAPGPVQIPAEAKPAPGPISVPMGPSFNHEFTSSTRPSGGNKRNSFHSTATADGESVYESAEEGGNGGDGDDDDESSSEEEHDESKYKVYENDRSVEAGRNVGPPAVERIPSQDNDYDSGDESDHTAHGADAANDDSSIDQQPAQLAKRKSVRMNVPGSPAVPVGPAQAPPPVTQQQGGHDYSTEDRAPSPERQRPDSQAWSSRIGQADPESEEDERDPQYNSARKGLIKNTGKWESVKAAAAGSPKRKKSVKGSKSGGSVKSDRR